MASPFSTLPEELLERILALALAPSPNGSGSVPPALLGNLTRSPSTPFPANLSRATSLRRPVASSGEALPKGPVDRYTPLLTCRTFARIGTPLLYSHLHLKTRDQCVLAMNTMQEEPELAQVVRSVRFDGIWLECKAVVDTLVQAGARLETFDFCITLPESFGASEVPGGAGEAVLSFCDALTLLPDLGTVKRLSIRKTADAYLTLAGPTQILECLSEVVPRWVSLDHLDIAFRLPSGPRVLNANPQPTSAPGQSSTSTISRFTSALACAPSLKVVSAQLPAAWNSALLEIASNPSLDAIHLSPAPPVAGAHLFLSEARKHPRLHELISNGTPALSSPVSPTHTRPRPSPIGADHLAANAGRLRANTTVGATSPTSASFPVLYGSACPPSSYVVRERNAPGPSSERLHSRSGSSSRQPQGSRRMSAV